MIFKAIDKVCEKFLGALLWVVEMVQSLFMWCYRKIKSLAIWLLQKLGINVCKCDK